MVNRLLGVLGWIGTALVFGAVAVRFLQPDWNQYAQWAAWAGLVCVLLYMAGQWRDIVTFYGRRQSRYGTVSLVGLIAVVGIVIAVNYLAVRRTKRWDLTANQVYSLSEQSIKVLQGMDAPVNVTVFFDERTPAERFRSRLEEYDYNSDQMSIEYVDLERNPARSKEREVTQATILIDYKGKTERISDVDEQSMTNALIKLASGQPRKIYFTQGHGEKDTASSDRAGYSEVASALKQDNYAVEKVALMQQSDVPADATAVIVSGPRTDFLPNEIESLKRFVAKGGKVMFLLDPPDTANAAPLTNITAFAKEWAIDVGNDVVVDASGIGRMFNAGFEVPIAHEYPSHPISQGFGGVMTAYPLARSVRPLEGGASGRNAQPVAQTRPESWAETDLKALSSGQKPEFSPDAGDRQGPVVLASAVSAPATEAPAPPSGNSSGGPTDPPKPESRVLVFGDSDFGANAYLGFQGNRDFFLNAVNWLAQQENLIAIRPRDPEDRRINVTADQLTRIGYLSVFIIPGLILAGGVYAWWRRR